MSNLKEIMAQEVDFLFDHQLIAAVETLVRSAKSKLLLVSPYIDLDARLIDALNEKKHLINFELLVLFGKNEYNYAKSLRKDSFEIFKQFPNVEIRYNERLHAKFYQNEVDYIMTSLNLYDYSLANNIEVGIKGEYASKGILGKVIDVGGLIMQRGIKEVQHNILGMDEPVDPVDKFRLIFEGSHVVYKTRAIVVEKSGISGFMGLKQLNGFNIIVNELDAVLPKRETNVEVNLSKDIQFKKQLAESSKQNIEGKYFSASQICKLFSVQSKEVSALMQFKGLINEERITELGFSKGLIYKTYMGNQYVAYPERLPEFRELQ